MDQITGTDDVSVEQFLDTIELLILSHPEMDGVEIDDSKGRTWFIQQIEGMPTSIN